MRSFKVEGIVLKRRNCGEADRVLTVLSKELGKIFVKAPGVRRIKSRRGAHIELLNYSQLTLYSGSKTFMPMVTEAQTLDDFSLIKNDLHKIGYAYYICELINGFCPDNQENRDVFFLLKNVLISLEKEKNYLGLISSFEKELLQTLGFWKEASILQAPASAESAGRQGSRVVMEKLLERKLKTFRVMPLFAS